MSTLISQIISGDQEPLLNAYRDHRDEFIHWAVRTYGASEEEAKDVFQDAIIIFFEKVNTGQLTGLSCSLKTYLFSLGKYKLINQYKKNSRMVTFNGDHMIKGNDISLDMKHDAEHNKKLVEDNLRKLPEKDRQILQLFYIEGLDMKTIAERMGYKNANVAKKKKYEVFRKLAGLIKNSAKLFMLV